MDSLNRPDLCSQKMGKAKAKAKRQSQSQIEKPKAIMTQSRIHHAGTILSQVIEGRQGYHLKGLETVGAEK